MLEIAFIILLLVVIFVIWSTGRRQRSSTLSESMYPGDWSLYGYSLPLTGNRGQTRIVRGPVAGGIITGQIIADMSDGCWRRAPDGSCEYVESCDLCPDCSLCPDCEKCGTTLANRPGFSGNPPPVY